jgi:hypothetical protein
MRVPLSEEEQRILQEMEQTLREHDREFVDRVSHPQYRLESPRGLKWSVVGFLAGTALLLGTFRASIALGICGVLVMTVSALTFAQHLGITAEPESDEDDDPKPGATATGATATRGELPDGPLSRRSRNLALADQWSEMRRRLRARFDHGD